jgi:uncharacterized protein YwlG (UPF0340 family)
MSLLEGLGRQITETGVQTLAIIVYFDVFEYLVPGILPRRESLPMDGVDIQAVVPALHGGGVYAVAFFLHAGNEAVVVQETAVVMRAVGSRDRNGL